MSAALLAHDGKHGTRETKGSRKIYIYHPRPIVVLQVREANIGNVHTGIVDQRVDAAEFAQRVRNQGIGLGGLGNVALECLGLMARAPQILGKGRGALLAFAIAKSHRIIRRGERTHDGRTDSPGSSGYESYLCACHDASLWNLKARC